jgi:hypothetical protein
MVPLLLDFSKKTIIKGALGIPVIIWAASGPKSEYSEILGIEDFSRPTD